MSTSPTDRFRRVDSIFDAAVDVPPGEQTAFVERECGGDEELRAEVLDLVRSYHRRDSVLEAPAARIAAPLLDAAAAIGGPAPDHIGAFRIVREIGRGGMGRVFLGERADGQFEQRVAIKLIQHGAPGVLRRFVEERRILALLAHPGIARLVDGGITDGGLPYFAMELVEGEPIDRYCDAQGLTLDERLELFAGVCDAVAYAHHQLVVHRDIKPSNILVTADGRAKLLDFGIAKLLGGRPTADGDTRTGFSAMTPEFAAPEQVRGTTVSTATDVYSLGVLLYLLVAGERPYDVRGLSAAEVERIVCVDDAPRPSAKAPPRWRRRLRGDLDLIVMTALQKEPARRYQSPAALAEDLQRFRRGRAILARPDSARYRLRKFVGRHRTGVAAAALLLLAGAGAASRERALRQRAEVEAHKAREVESFLVGVFDVADPGASGELRGGSVTARELLDRGARRLESGLGGQPEVQAALRSTLGRVYTNLGLYDRATPLLRQALAQHTALHGADDPSVAADLHLLGDALTQLDRYDEAEPLLRRALGQRRRERDGRDTATAATLDRLATLLEGRNRYEEAVPLYREALQIYRSALGDTAAQVGSATHNLALGLFGKGELAEAEPLERRALGIHRRRLGENHPRTAQVMESLALMVARRRGFAEAERLHYQALAIKRRTLGNAHPSVTITLNNLSQFLTRNTNRLDEAEALVREALVLDRRIFGDRHSYVAEGLRNLGIVLRTKGELAGSERALREALEIDRGLLAAPHRKLAAIYAHLAQTVHQRGNTAEAIGLMRQSLAHYRGALGEAHVNTLSSAGILGRMLATSGGAAEGERLLRRTLAGLDSSRAEHLVAFLDARRALGEATLAQGRAEEALPVLAGAVAAIRDHHGAESWRTAEAQLAYGEALAAALRDAEARLLLLAARATLEKHGTAQPRLAARAASAVARLRD